MPDRLLYTQYIPEDSLAATQTRERRNVSLQSTITSGLSTSEAVSMDPAEQRLRGYYRGQRADLMAGEIEGLFSAPDIPAVPYVGVNTTTEQDGYYTLENVDTRPVKPQASESLHRFDGVLRLKGTRKSHLRSVATTIADLPNDFGNNDAPRVGIDVDTVNPRWFDTESRDIEEATPVATRNAEFADIDVFDPSSSSFSDPTLVGDLEYVAEGDADVRVWSTMGNADREDANGNVQWRKVYRPSYDDSYPVVIANGLVRLTLDESANSISAETWDDGAGAWTSVSLGTSDWELLDVDLTRIGTARIDAQLTFRDPTQSPTTYYALDARLCRGADAVLFTTPSRSTQGATPSGLQTLLDPIASESRQTAGVEAGLVRRQEVRY